VPDDCDINRELHGAAPDTRLDFDGRFFAPYVPAAADTFTSSIP
jgi:hypothetical protein